MKLLTSEEIVAVQLGCTNGRPCCKYINDDQDSDGELTGKRVGGYSWWNVYDEAMN